MVIATGAIREAARKLYSDKMPYHNFSHALRVLGAARTIMGHCKEEGVQVDEEVVTYAALLHDAGYHLDHTKAGFDNKEQYSAFLAGEALYNQKISLETIKDVTGVILATHRDAPFDTTEQKVVRAADLSGMAGPYHDFLTNNRNLKEEFEMLHKVSISWDEWKKKTSEIIEFYLKQDIELTSHYKDQDGNSVFHTRTRANLSRFLEDIIQD